MPQPNKYGRVTVEIDHTQYDAAAKIAGKEGRKIYAVIGDWIAAGMERDGVEREPETVAEEAASV